MENKNIRMLSDQLGSEDGVTVNTYRADKTYSVSAALAKTFIDCGLAEPADDGDASLASMKVADLKALAEAEGVTLSEAKTKGEIVEAIERARAMDAAGA